MKALPEINVLLAQMEDSLSRVVLINGEYVGVLSEYGGRWTILHDGCGFLRDGEAVDDMHEAARELVWHALNVTWKNGDWL